MNFSKKNHAFQKKIKTMNTILLILSLFFITSCNDDENNTFQSVEITPILIGQGSLSGNNAENISQSNLVINNQSDWQNLMTQMDSYNNVTSAFSETNIDFGNFQIIAIFLEVKPTGWGITITNITENENNIVMSTEEQEGVATVISQPFHIVKIPINNKPIVFG